MNKQASIRSQARRAALTKAAAAQPTLAEQAFAAGFCKAAEAMGVDPAELAKAADWVTELKDYSPAEENMNSIVSALTDKQNRGIDIEKYRTNGVANAAAAISGGTLGTLGSLGAAGLMMDAKDRDPYAFGRAKDWIRSVRKLAPRFSVRHPGVAKALGRLANTGTKAGFVGLAALPALWGISAIRNANRRADINKAIDTVKGKK